MLLPEDQQNLERACAAITAVRNGGGGLLILTGAGMSVQSGVPVFRAADGTMSADFLRYLAAYNGARRAHSLPEAADWFDFSVPEMFRPETAREAWHYWRWRTLRALVEPAADYRELRRLLDYFGPSRAFVETSNCDQLHAKAGLGHDALLEIHGSLGRLQCAGPCAPDLLPADGAFLARLRDEPDWVPSCPKCARCLRPNVMIFGDDCLVFDELDREQAREKEFLRRFSRPPPGGESGGLDLVVLEVGAGVVVPSIRHHAEAFGRAGAGLIRVNPSAAECAAFESGAPLPEGKYWPLKLRSATALAAIADALGLPPNAPNPNASASAAAIAGADVPADADDGVAALASRPLTATIAACAVHSAWPFNVLRARRQPGGDVVVAIPVDLSGRRLPILIDLPASRCGLHLLPLPLVSMTHPST
jgi:NAD-dependent SIR2 family protein deacetylase